VGPALAFSGLWGVPFLTTQYGLTPAGSAAITSTLLVAWAVGGFVLGALSDRIGRRKLLYMWAAAIAGLGWVLALYLPGLPVWVFAGLVTLVGIASGVVSTGFAFVKESVPPRLSGIASGFLNMGYMMGPMVLQPVMGWVLDHYWNGALQGGVRIYDLQAYHHAFAPMVAWSLLAVVLLAFTTETHCRQMVGDSG
jgi:MFS family permease